MEGDVVQIAVLIPVYNAERFLRECLDSVVNQTVTDFELLVANDGSTDSSLSILEEYAAKDNRIHVLENPKNLGIVATRNRLLTSLPEYIKFVAWMDADDVMFPDRLQRQFDYLEKHPEIGGVGSSLEIIDEKSCVIGYRYYPESPEKIRKILPLSNVLAQPAMMIRRTVISSTGMYSSNGAVCDYEYWLRCLEHCQFANLSTPVLHYRISGGQVKQSELKRSLAFTMEIQRDYFRQKKQRMPFALLCRHLAGALLMRLPSEWVLKLFCFLTYRPIRRERK